MTKRLLFSSFLLFLTSVFVYMHLSQKKATNSHNTFSDSEKEEADFYRTNYYVNLNNNGMELNDIMLKDSLGIISPLKNLLEKEKKQILVCRFSQFHCESCVNFSIQMLLHSSFIEKENLLFLGSYENNRIFNREKKLYDIDTFKTYNALSLNIPLEELGFPYFFVLNENLTISHIVIPDKNTPALTQKYLEIINERYFEKATNK